LRFKTVYNDSVIEIRGKDPIVDDRADRKLVVTWPLKDPAGEIKMIFNESSISITADGKHLENWYLDLSYARDKDLPFVSINTNRIDCNYKGFDYSIAAKAGAFVRENDTELRVIPEKKGISLEF